MILRNQLREVYAVVWTVVIFLIPVYIIFYPVLFKIINIFGIFSPINFFIFFALLILFGISLHFSALNSILQRNLKNAIQKISILEEDVRKLQNNRSLNKTKKSDASSYDNRQQQ